MADGVFDHSTRRYVTRREKASQDFARQRLEEMAQDTTSRPQAILRRYLTPLLQYHTDCDRAYCELADTDDALGLQRLRIVFLAALANYNARL